MILVDMSLAENYTADKLVEPRDTSREAWPRLRREVLSLWRVADVEFQSAEKGW